MKLRYVVMSLLLSLITFTSYAQIQLSPVADGNVEGLNGDAKGLIENKLKNILTSKKIMSKMGQGRFVLAAHLTILEKEILGTAPTKICYRLNVQLAVGDGITGNCFGTTSLEVKGVGNTEIKAVTNAIRSINPRHPMVGELVEQGSKAIYEYYEKNIGSILKTAQTLAASEKFDEALLELSVVPKDLKEYSQVNDLMLKINRSRINLNAVKILTQAKAQWAGNPTPENAANAMAILSEINPSSSCYSEAQSFIKQVSSSVAKMNRQEKLDDMAMQKARLQSIENIAVAEAKNKPKVVYNVYSWW